jgi:hypothetical protein
MPDAAPEEAGSPGWEAGGDFKREAASLSRALDLYWSSFFRGDYLFGKDWLELSRRWRRQWLVLNSRGAGKHTERTGVAENVLEHQARLKRLKEQIALAGFAQMVKSALTLGMLAGLGGMMAGGAAFGAWSQGAALAGLQLWYLTTMLFTLVQIVSVRWRLRDSH